LVVGLFAVALPHSEEFANNLTLVSGLIHSVLL